MEVILSREIRSQISDFSVFFSIFFRLFPTFCTYFLLFCFLWLVFTFYSFPHFSKHHKFSPYFFQFHTFSYNIDYKDTRTKIIRVIKFTIISYNLTVTTVWFSYAIFLKMELEEILNGTFKNLCWCGIGLYIVTCCVILTSIRTRLKIVNKILLKKLSAEKLRRVAVIHMKLSQLASAMGNTFSFQVAAGMCFEALHVTFGFFEIFSGIKEDFRGFKLQYSIFAIVENLCLTSYIFIFTGISSFTVKSGWNSMRIIHEEVFRELRDGNEKEMRRIQMFLMQLQHYNVKLSCGFYDFNWKAVMIVSWVSFYS